SGAQLRLQLGSAAQAVCGWQLPCSSAAWFRSRSLLLNLSMMPCFRIRSLLRKSVPFSFAGVISIGHGPRSAEQLLQRALSMYLDERLPPREFIYSLPFCSRVLISWAGNWSAPPNTYEHDAKRTRG